MSLHYNLLIIAILKQAKIDYITALRKNNPAKKAELERFFLSDYGQAMSRNQGEKIIYLCKRIVKEKRKKEKRKNG